MIGHAAYTVPAVPLTISVPALGPTLPRNAFRLAWTEPLAARRRLDGLYIWNWYGYGGPGTTSYTPRGKPAAMTVKRILADLEKP